MSLQRNSRLNREQRLKKLSRNRWKWGGCSHNMDFGIQFSKSFLDADEKNSADIQSLIKLHNNEAGRLVSTFLDAILEGYAIYSGGGCNYKGWRRCL